jgi:ABC-2 type transport system ATP-binding protein
MTTIQLTDVVKDIKGKRIIDHVSLQMESGKISGLKGVNGSGKTMLMRLIAGLITPTSGSILINGKRLGKDITFPESIGILIENPAFLDAYSGFDNLKMLASIQKKITDDHIRETLSLVGLDPYDKKKYRKYSLGMKQRLGIAAAVMEDPDIVILDEPTNALDSDGVAMLKDILKRQKERNALVVISCHDLDTLKELSDEIFLMESGALRPYHEEG